MTTTSTETRSVLRDAAERFPTALWNDSADPDELRQSIAWGAVGATCNPVIAMAAIAKAPERWSARARAIAAERPTASESEIGWALVEELSIDAAQQLEPAFWASGGRDGRLSMQTDPRLRRDPDALVAQAERFSSLAPNVIVKIPATAAGIVAIEEATFRGVSINVTVSFTVAQALAAGAAIERGLDRRAAAGLATGELGSVVTVMGGRVDDWLKSCVARDRVLVDPGVLEWAGVAVLKRAHAEFRARGYRSRLLAAAFRNHMHWSELQGGDLVVSPPFDWQARIVENGIVAEDRIDVPVDADVLRVLVERVPEFTRAYEPDGLAVEEFDGFGATVRTLRQFLEADEQLDRFVRDAILPAP